MVSRKAVRRPVAPGELPEFEPVPRRRPRHDGWTPERQRAVVAALADTGCTAIACRMVNMSQESFYQLRRQPGAEGFRRACDAAQALGLQPVRDEAFHRAMVGQLVPVFAGGKLMGFRRKKNDRLLMFILRHYGEDAQGRKTTVNYFSTRATAAAGAAIPPPEGEGERACEGGPGGPPAAQPDARHRLANHGGGVPAAEASTTTVKTVISGPAGGPTRIANDDEAANILNAFEGVDLDAEARDQIYRALEACAERRRALEDDPENDPDCLFASPSQARGGAYLGELELGTDPDWVEYRPEGEHLWENLGEGGAAAEVDRVLAGIAERKALLGPAEQAAEARPEQSRRAEADPEPPAPSPREPVLSPSKRPYRKRTPKPTFTPPDKAREAEARAEVQAARRAHAAAEAKRRGQRKA